MPLAKVSLINDVLFVKRDTAESKKKDTIQILSSSPRRKHNLEISLSELVPFKFNYLTFSDVRGNIETRLKKFIELVSVDLNLE